MTTTMAKPGDGALKLIAQLTRRDPIHAAADIAVDLEMVANQLGKDLERLNDRAVPAVEAAKFLLMVNDAFRQLLTAADLLDSLEAK